MSTDNVTAYGLAGTPATCAQVGLSGVLGGGPFDLLVSGVNLGCDVFYSGTVGAGGHDEKFPCRATGALD